MTVIINTVWGGIASQIVDRQISTTNNEIYDQQSNKVCIVLTKDALVSITYTGIAVANKKWLDCVIANCLSHKQLNFAVAQPGSPYLARPIHTIINELSINLNGALNRDKRAQSHNLRISIIGWHLGKKTTPLAWELFRGVAEENGNRFFKVKYHKIGKFFREHPTGLWCETLGDSGTSVDENLKNLSLINSLNHDEVERHIRESVIKRSTETITVSADCVAVQLNPYDHDGQVQFTYYPAQEKINGHQLLSPWVLTPRLICAPSEMNSSSVPVSKCGVYVVGGFEDPNTKLSIRTRIPINDSQTFRGVISTNFQKRKITI